MTKPEKRGREARLERERDHWRDTAMRLQEQIEALTRKAAARQPKYELADSQYPG